MTRFQNTIAERARGFTLIELLIVVAIIAIISAGSMAVITGPVFEKAHAEDRQAFETGAGVFFPTLLADAHAADALAMIPGDASATTVALVLRASRPAEKVVRYQVDDAGNLVRRVEGGSEAKLISNVTSFTAQQLEPGTLWAVTVTGRMKGYDGLRMTTATRRMHVRVGTAGGGA